MFWLFLKIDLGTTSKGIVKQVLMQELTIKPSSMDNIVSVFRIISAGRHTRFRGLRNFDIDKHEEQTQINSTCLIPRLSIVIL